MAGRDTKRWRIASETKIYPCSSAYCGVAATRLYAVSICG